MKIKRKYAAIVGVLVMVALGFWMRELASWRPVLVGTMLSDAWQMRVSRDGKWLWTRDSLGFEETFALQPPAPPAPRPIAMEDTSPRLPKEARAFHAAHGIIPPRFWFELRKQATHFVRRDGDETFFGKQVHYFSRRDGIVELRDVTLGYGFAPWSLAREEIYSVDGNVISIWNMKNWRLKREVKFFKEYKQDGDAESVFSPDGKWLISVHREGTEDYYRLSRYEVQSGKLMPSPDIAIISVDDSSLQFSTDGRYLLAGGGSDEERVLILDAANWKLLWSAQSVLSGGFAPDNRVGIVKTGGFEWRNVQTGKILQSFPHPAKGTQLWTVSPDGKWIYAANDKKQIVRWRAW